MRAYIEYVRILHLAGSTMESVVEAVLATLLEAGEEFDYARVKQLAVPGDRRPPARRLAAAHVQRMIAAALALIRNDHNWPM